MGQGVKRAGGVCAIAFALSGCLSDVGGGLGEGVSSRFKSVDLTSTGGKTKHQEKINSESQIIQGLAARRSALPSGSSYSKVATSVLAANSRAAESELRSARLRSEAASKNWLPKIGPQISLSSLGSVVANLVVDQVLFDNGRKKGEREFAIADVEVAAVSLAQDTNARVATALGLYTDAVEAREKAALASQSLKEMGHFNWIMEERVKGGVSDMSDLNILTQKLAEIKADQRSNTEKAATSIAELSDTLLGLGTGATLKAIEATKEAAGRRVAQANEDSNRQLRKLEGEIAAKGRQASEAASLTIAAKSNLDLFRQQYDAGQRQVLDVVNVYETFARQQQAEVTLKYETLRLKIEMADLIGVLADGNAI